MAPVWAVGTVLPGWRPWFRAAVSAENLKPIIKSTVSQSAFIIPMPAVLNNVSDKILLSPTPKFLLVHILKQITVVIVEF